MAASDGSRRLSPLAAAALAAAAGFLGWALFSVGGSGREAWDSSSWWNVMLPLLAGLAGALGFLVPARVWRWSVAIVAGQVVAMLLFRPQGSDLGLLPLTIAFLLIPLAIGLTIPAVIGGVLARGGWDPALL